LAPQVRISPPIDASTVIPIVLASIDFDHEAGGIAREVHDQMIDGHLTAKVKSFALEHAQASPELSLSVGLVAAQAASALVRHCFLAYATPTPNPSPQGGGA
jgi:hypothetical protein